MRILTHQEAYAPYADTEYGAEREAVSYPEGFRELLVGKPLEEQLAYFRVAENTSFSRSSHGEVDRERRDGIRGRYQIPGTRRQRTRATYSA